jgi:hypothetical protein
MRMKRHNGDMAEEMTNGNTEHRIYTDAITAQLGERVTNLGRRQSDLESEMRTGFKQMEAAVGALATEMRSSVAALATNMAERNKPQWQAIAVALSFCTVVGGLVYWPIQNSQTDMKVAMTAIVDKMVSRQEMDWRQARGQEDRARTDQAVADLRAAQVPRTELERVWHTDDLVNAQLQKQIDELKANQSQTYSARDLLLDMRERQDRLERQLYQRASPAG